MPMHIPVLLSGLVIGPYFGFLTGLFGPLLSHFTQGMPTGLNVPVMMIELSAYGLFCGLFAKIFERPRFQKNSRYFSLYASMIPAMLIGRVVGGLARIALVHLFTPNLISEAWLAVWVSSYFITSAPGIIIQLVLIPSIVIALEKSKVIS